MIDKQEDTQETRIILTDNPHKSKKDLRVLWIFPLALLASLVVFAVAYVALLRPLMAKPISPKLGDVLNPNRPTIEAYYRAGKETDKEEIKTQIAFPTQLQKPPLLVEDTPVPKPETPEANSGTPESEPIDQDAVCDFGPSMMFLLVGIDAKVDSYRAGLADVIRLIRIDFANQKVNMIALPRDMMVDFPASRTSLASPMKINQAYFLGTEGVGRYAGGGNGAHSLAEAIDYNFGVKVEHYMVVNFNLVQSVIDAVGGVDVDLPQAVEDDYFGYYPAGPQHLDGEKALILMRIRMKYTDDFRVGNQTIVLKAMLEKMRRPEMVLKIPKLVSEFRNNVLTDLSVDELIKLGNCFVKEFESKDINAKQFTREHIQPGREYIPSADMYLFVYKWGDAAVQFIHNTLMGK